MSENLRVWADNYPRDWPVEGYMRLLETMKMLERRDIARRNEFFRICPDCRTGAHRNPPAGSTMCQCDDRKCACHSGRP